MKFNIFEKYLNKYFIKQIKESEINLCNNEKFYIETLFNKKDLNDTIFIKKYRKEIKQFFDDGYENAGLGKFLSCFDKNSIKNNTKILKIARHKETQQILAMTIYNGFGGPDAKKCVGGTILKTNDTDLKNLAKKALEFIIKEDVHCQTDFYWCECSEAIKHWWEKYGGIKLPNAYLPMFMEEKYLNNIKYIENEKYDYYRIIGKDTDHEITLRKCIFGFPNKDVLEKYINEQNTNIKKCENKLNNINENISIELNIDKILHKNRKIMEYFGYYIMDEYDKIFELTEYEFNILLQTVNSSQFILNNYYNKLTQNHIDNIYYWNDISVNILIISTILKPYKLGNDFLITHEFDQDLINKFYNKDIATDSEENFIL